MDHNTCHDGPYITSSCGTNKQNVNELLMCFKEIIVQFSPPPPIILELMND